MCGGGRGLTPQCNCMYVLYMPILYMYVAVLYICNCIPIILDVTVLYICHCFTILAHMYVRMYACVPVCAVGVSVVVVVCRRNNRNGTYVHVRMCIFA